MLRERRKGKNIIYNINIFQKMERLSALQSNGCGEAYDPHAPITHTKSPIVQGTSVLGVKYKVS